jgi:hypothetical protein
MSTAVAKIGNFIVEYSCEIESILGLGRKFSFSFFRESFRETHFSFSRNICDENTKLSQKFSQKRFAR